MGSMDWRLLLEPRPAYGMTEIARALGKKPGTVRQWLFRAKRHIVWGSPYGFPNPDTTIGGRPVWMARTISWWLGLQVLAQLNPALANESEYEPEPTDVELHPDDPRWTGEGVLIRGDSPGLAGKYAMRLARETDMPPLLVALSVLAAEAELEGLSASRWKNRVTATAIDLDPSSGYFVASAIRRLRTDFPAFWPWGAA